MAYTRKDTGLLYGFVNGSTIVSGDELINTDADYVKTLQKTTRSLGVPPKYNMDIDVQYVDEVAPGYGRVFGKTILSSPTIISICPGMVTMLPNFSLDNKYTIFESIKEAASGNSAILQKIMAEDSGWTAKLFSFESDTAEYAKYLNVLCRASAILMGVGDELMPNTSIPLKNFDYAYWRERNNYVDTKAAKDRSIWTDFWSGGLSTVSGGISDSSYIHFFVNNQETSISENIATSTSAATILPSAASSLGTLTANLNYYLSGRQSAIMGSDVVSEMQEAVAALTDSGDILHTIGNNLLKGGQLVFPDMLSESTYSKDIRASMDFISPYGDPLSIFLQCNVPACHLLALAVPRQLSDNMYTFPFCVRVYQTGNFYCDLAVISGIEINRGGDDGTAWTVDGLSTAWNVTITITPLYSNLMITDSSHPFMFIKNEGLLEYLGNLCGVDLKANHVWTKMQLMASFSTNTIRDIPASLGRRLGQSFINSSMATKIKNFFMLVGN